MNYNIIYHRDADGIFSAYHIMQGLKSEQNSIIKTIDIQYGETIDIQSLRDTIVYIVDFSFNPAILNNIARLAFEVIVIDHHASANKELILNKPILASNIEIIIDINHAGCMLCKKYREDVLSSVVFPLEQLITEYVEDRDLWRFNLDESEAVNEYINLNIDVSDLKSIPDFMQRFTIINAKLAGNMLIKYKNKLIDTKINDDNIQKFSINNVECIGFNSTNFISEIGNKLCNKYKKVSVQYFILANTDVVLSFRSLDDLDDVSILAKQLGGGGHPNAAGATITFDQFSKLIEEKTL